MAIKDNLVNVEKLQEEVKAQQEQTYNWTYENGRRYAASELGHYYMPNDEPEIQRLNQQHWMLTEAKGGTISLAPLPKKDGLKILDIGCGTGIWCLQMAEDYPTASIIGADISPIQPKNTPAGVSWTVLDFENQEWPFPENHFDLIHLALVHGCVQDWAKMMGKIVNHIAPGGFIEHHEFAMGSQYVVTTTGERVDMSQLQNQTAYARWPRLMAEAADKRGRTLHLGPKLKGFQEKAGLLHVTDTIYPLPVGTWPEEEKQRRIGGQFLINMLAGIDGFTTVLFTKALGWGEEETKAFIEQCKLDLKDNDMRKMVDMHVVYGQKPANGEAQAS